MSKGRNQMDPIARIFHGQIRDRRVSPQVSFSLSRALCSQLHTPEILFCLVLNSTNSGCIYNFTFILETTGIFVGSNRKENFVIPSGFLMYSTITNTATSVHMICFNND